MQIAHRKTQTDHKALSDRTEALAARLDAAQADLRSALGAHEDTEALRTRVQAAETLMAELQTRLASAEAQQQQQQQPQPQVSPCIHAHTSALGAHMAQSPAVVDVEEPTTTTTTTRKRKREEEEEEAVAVEEEAAAPAAHKRKHTCGNGRKRARRFVWAAVHTAAAATVGAVAAWSALAFA